MTRLTGMTLKKFGELVEDMRRVYPFEDDRTCIVDTRDEFWDAHRRLDIYTHDVENDVHIRLSKGIDEDEDKYFELYNEQKKGGENDED